MGAGRAVPAVVTAAVAVVMAVGGWEASRALASGPAGDGGGSVVPTSTAVVVHTNLTTTTQLPGTLGYAGSYQVVNQAQGTAFTALPSPGRVVRRGQDLYEVDGTGIPLFYAARPMWRAIQAGAGPGADVYQLDQNLIALGYTDAGYLTPSDTFTAATAAAIDEWQSARGLIPTGSVQPGQVVFGPGPLRVVTVAAALGATPQPGAVVLDATFTRRVVTVSLPVTQEYLVKKGDAVTVTLPDGTTTTPGVVSFLAPVATAAAPAGNSGQTGGPASGGSSAGGSAGGASGETVAMTVRLTHPAAAGRFDQAPVEVNIVDARAGNVLAVPVNALVALAGGGYGVEVTDGSRRNLLAVRTGLFATTLVQVSGAGLRPGMRVEVPKS
ncbi:MAG TPA: peptidoglycan-binding protein [Streptosporangiaceae bacterium]|nr:peptidoglycan-binding protein [Streptosporangiaceae bacterium]